jgi:hypothetical protein
MIHRCWLLLSLAVLTGGCQKYLNIIPDDVATIDNAFTLRQEAIKYLATCYSYLPDEADYNMNPAIGGGDEVWLSETFSSVSGDPIRIAKGYQNATAPYMGIWANMYKAIRDCNIFLDNVDKVVDLQPYEKKRWIAEVKFLKGYYHWLLLRMYGPIPVVDVNLPVTATAREVQVYRQPVDSVVNYIARLFDQAAPDLPLTITSTANELGRLTKPAALAIKARLLVTAASPLFNGNAFYAGFQGSNGIPLFSSTYDPAKWQKAADACRSAITACDSAGLKLYRFNDPLVSLDDKLSTQMSIRNAVCAKWNEELIWGSSNARGDAWVQRMACPKLDPARLGNADPLGELAPTLKMAELFYTAHGVPINEDRSYDYNDRYKPRKATGDDAPFLQENYETAGLNFDREPRYYADLSFDGDRWFKLDGTWDVQCKFGQNQSQKDVQGFSMTGYFTKKTVSWKFVINEGQSTSTEEYPWPTMRLADLYLLYAEALNEAADVPPADAFVYINKVRDRAGIGSVQDAWTNYSKTPSKYTTKSGFRDIVQQERGIEMAFEGSRFWDLRRWKRSGIELNKTVTGWNIPAAATNSYYIPVTLYTQSFTDRDYLWPIASDDLLVNPHLIQNRGW